MDYIARHIGPDQHEQQELLHVLGYDSIDALIAAAVTVVVHLLAGRRTLVSIAAGTLAYVLLVNLA